jgi:hypothetical protein
MPAETEIEAMMCACSRKAVGVLPSNMRCQCSSWSCFKHFLNSVVIDIINLVQTKRRFLFPLCLNQPTAPITTFINETLIIIMNYKMPTIHMPANTESLQLSTKLMCFSNKISRPRVASCLCWKSANGWAQKCSCRREGWGARGGKRRHKIS